MKTKILLLLAFLSLGSFVYAQEKDISGNYRGRGGGIMLLPNKLFVLWGYMTAIPGSYEVQKDGIIRFKPKKEPLRMEKPIQFSMTIPIVFLLAIYIPFQGRRWGIPFL